MGGACLLGEGEAQVRRAKSRGFNDPLSDAKQRASDKIDQFKNVFRNILSPGGD